MSERAFLDVDTQADFVEPGGKLYAAGAEAIKPNLEQLVRHADQNGIPLISCVDAHPAEDPEFKDWPPHAIVGTPGQLKVSESQTNGMVFVPSGHQSHLPDPKREHVVLEKQHFNCFTNENAEEVFAATGAQTVVVFGVVTEVCVRQAAEALLKRGYQVELVTDAIWPLDPAKGEEVLAELEAKGARRTSTADVLAVAKAS